MRLFAFIVVFSSLFSCQKKSDSIAEEPQNIISDSIVNVLHSQWKFKTPEYSEQVYYVLNNWAEWREMTHSLQQKPAKSIHSIQKKTADLVAQVEKLHNTIPEAYRYNTVKSRLNLLQTHTYQLDMYLELIPIPLKDIQPLFSLIQKDITSITQQFEEIVVKNKIPVEDGEETMKIKIDTVRKATKLAIPLE